MAKTKDVIVRRNDGLYVMLNHRIDQGFGFTSKANATHFTGKSAAIKLCPNLLYSNVRYIDLNNKKDKKREKIERQKSCKNSFERVAHSREVAVAS